MKSTIVSRGIACAVCFVVLCGMGCSTVDPSKKIPFKYIDSSYRLKPGKIAIICDSSSEISIKIVSEITDRLRKGSTLTVMGQDEIEEKIPPYPFKFLEPQIKSHDQWANNPELLSGPNKEAVGKFQKILNADYVYILLHPNLFWYENTSCEACIKSFPVFPKTNAYQIYIIGRLVEYPSGRVVALTSYVKKNTYSSFRSKNGSIDKLLVSASEDIADKILETTGSSKRIK